MPVPGWSHSALTDFENCPKQYKVVKIDKRYPFVDTQETIWGRRVHKDFENRLLYSTPLPLDVAMHEDFLARFAAQPGELAGEERIALDTNLRGCAYFARDVQVWYRGQVDARKRDRARGFAHILDHKTGKVKNDFSQLKGFAMWEFLTQPDIHEVKVEFYWTQIRGANGETYYREQLPAILLEFAPRLRRYMEAHQYRNFPAKQSGLCNGWCPVTDCEFWRERRKP